MKELANLEKSRQLKSTPVDLDEIAAMIRAAERRMEDARNTKLAYESRFDLAYNAAHGFALAALRHHGFRSENRYLVFQCLTHTLGYAPSQWRLFDLAHRRRNLAEYEGDWEIDENFLAELVLATQRLCANVRNMTV
jgi:hypothetical protein